MALESDDLETGSEVWYEGHRSDVPRRVECLPLRHVRGATFRTPRSPAAHGGAAGLESTVDITNDNFTEESRDRRERRHDRVRSSIRR